MSLLDVNDLEHIFDGDAGLMRYFRGIADHEEYDTLNHPILSIKNHLVLYDEKEREWMSKYCKGDWMPVELYPFLLFDPFAEDYEVLDFLKKT